MIRYLPGHSTVGLVVIVVVVVLASWLALATSTINLVLGTCRKDPLSRIRAALTPRQLRRRNRGDFDATGGGDRVLRSIGHSRTDVMRRTDWLIKDLASSPNVRVVRGVRLPGHTRTVTPHAVSAGRRLVLLESVAWPPGEYTMDASGPIRCDGRIIGQSAHPLVRVVRAFRALLPRTHRARGLVVVHPSERGRYTFPAPTKDLAWVLAEDLPARLHQGLAPHSRTISRHTLASLAQIRSQAAGHPVDDE